MGLEISRRACRENGRRACCGRPTGRLSVGARVSLQHALAAWDAPRHQTCREGAGTKQSRRIELECQAKSVCEEQEARPGVRARRVWRAFLDLSSVIPNS